MMIFIIVGIILFIIILIVIALIPEKCSKCKGKMIIKKKALIDKKPSSIIKKLYKKNSDGKTIETQEVSIPATIYTYKILKECEKCGNLKTVIEEVKKAN